MSPALRLGALAACLAAAAGLAAAVGPRSAGELGNLFDGVGVWAPLLFAVCWTALTPALAPGTLLAAGAGLLFGIAVGMAVALVGATAGGVLAFVVARRSAGDAIEQLQGERLRRLQERVERRGFISVLVARAAPGVPTTLLNYACGLSRVRLRDFALATLLGGAPRLFGYTALGDSGGDLSSPIALAGFAVMAALTVMAVAGAIARRRLAGARPV